ncbi:MAG: serine protease [Candidatus Doudnabacteria bacterium]|nr:serine protease [Candidatus Doudnabacteria bacterium]
MRTLLLTWGRSLGSSFPFTKEKSQDNRTTSADRRTSVKWVHRIMTMTLVVLTACYATSVYNKREEDQKFAKLNTAMAALEMELSQVRTSIRVPDTAGQQAQFKQDFAREMGLVPLSLLRSRAKSFVELDAYDDQGASNYGTAGYLGNGYFITVKHAVVALGQEGLTNPRHVQSIQISYKGRKLLARLVDAGEAQAEVDPGDWAILKVRESLDLPPLTIDLAYAFDSVDPIFRLGNDYSKGIILASGYVGQKTPNGLVTCLTDGHPGVSGGGVLDQEGDLVGIPIGRMQGDYRFSFILPLQPEMFRKVPHRG